MLISIQFWVKSDEIKTCNLFYGNQIRNSSAVVGQGYTQEEAVKAMGVGKSTVSKWVTQLIQERNGQSLATPPMTPEQIEIHELKKQIQRIELEKGTSKKATALLRSDSLNSPR